MKRKTIRADQIVTVHSKTRVRIHLLKGLKSKLFDGSSVATTSIGKKKWARFCYQELIKAGYSV